VNLTKEAKAVGPAVRISAELGGISILHPNKKDSKKINEVRYPCIIGLSSGMVTGGRVLHHLSSPSDPRNQVIFIGFQAPAHAARSSSGSKVRSAFILKMCRSARTWPRLEQFSDHADTEELLRWLQTFTKRPLNYVSGSRGTEAGSSAANRPFHQLGGT